MCLECTWSHTLVHNFSDIKKEKQSQEKLASFDKLEQSHFIHCKSFSYVFFFFLQNSNLINVQFAFMVIISHYCCTLKHVTSWNVNSFLSCLQNKSDSYQKVVLH
jgi:hypothetical protein